VVELAFGRRQFGAGLVHRLGELVGNEVGDELLGLLNIDRGIREAVRPVERREHEDRWIDADDVEETVGARLSTPASLRVLIQPIGRGTTSPVSVQYTE